MHDTVYDERRDGRIRDGAAACPGVEGYCVERPSRRGKQQRRPDSFVCREQTLLGRSTTSIHSIRRRIPKRPRPCGWALIENDIVVCRLAMLARDNRLVLSICRPDAPWHGFLDNLRRGFLGIANDAFHFRKIARQLDKGVGVDFRYRDGNHFEFLILQGRN